MMRRPTAIASLTLGAALAASVAACDPLGSTVSPPGDDAIAGRLETIAARCGLPSGTLKLTGDGLVAIRPPPGTDYARVDCLLTEIRNAGFKQRHALIGNEAHETGNQR